jgi:L,D-transpeptidase ErfK/SrfK
MRHALKGCLGVVFLCGWSQASLVVAAEPAPITPLTEVIESRIQPNLPDIQPILPEVQTVRLVLKLQERRLYVYDGERIKATYPVAVGKAGWETPKGEFRVLEMVRQPGWTNPFTQEVMPPGPDNPLGDRWIAFWTDGTNYVGFHGTPNRASVGQSASHGCVRMFNEHVRELYETVQIGTPVVVEQ